MLIPLLFMGDIVGRLFREFAVTLSITILASAVVSLTLTPMMSSKLLKPQTEAAQEPPLQSVGTGVRVGDRVLWSHPSLGARAANRDAPCRLCHAVLHDTCWL